ncbi:MAG: hypothetical protein PHU85_10500 [Phycisphaerae bacterium]|nr:hypothetical protein [Phycisphaerae bacterium]
MAFSNRFPNGAVAVARHLRELEEDWHGGFARDKAKDQAYLVSNPPPTEAIRLDGFKVAGHDVTYAGTQAVVFRVDAAGRLAAFAGAACKEITVDGRTTRFADRDLPLVIWSPVAEECRVKGGAVFQVRVNGAGTVRIPAAGLPANVRLIAEGTTAGSRGVEIPCRIEGESLIFEAKGPAVGRWLYVVPAAAAQPASQPAGAK